MIPSGCLSSSITSTIQAAEGKKGQRRDGIHITLYLVVRFTEKCSLRKLNSLCLVSMELEPFLYYNFTSYKTCWGFFCIHNQNESHSFRKRFPPRSFIYTYMKQVACVCRHAAVDGLIVYIFVIYILWRLPSDNLNFWGVRNPPETLKESLEVLPGRMHIKTYTPNGACSGFLLHWKCISFSEIILKNVQWFMTHSLS